MRSSIGAMLLGSVMIYAVGVPWLMAAIDVPLEEALTLGLYPFLIGDTLKLLAAAGLLPDLGAAQVHRSGSATMSSREERIK